MGIFNHSTDSDSTPAGAACVGRKVKRSRGNGWRDLIICIVVVLLILIYRDSVKSEECSVVYYKNKFTVTMPETEETAAEAYDVAYDQIEAVELYTDFASFDRGEKISGSDYRQHVCGTYRNSEFGEYFMCVVPKYEYYLVIHQPDGIIVFNDVSKQDTEDTYKFLLQAIEANQGA